MREISKGSKLQKEKKNYRQSINSEREESVFPNHERFQGIIPKQTCTALNGKSKWHTGVVWWRSGTRRKNIIYVMLIHENLKINFKIIPKKWSWIKLPNTELTLVINPLAALRLNFLLNINMLIFHLYFYHPVIWTKEQKQAIKIKWVGYTNIKP